MCTANSLDTIPGPLLDRMEVIRLSGYASDEKRSIARRYLEPQSAKDAGVPQGAAQLTDDAMDMLINKYCRCVGGRRGEVMGRCQCRESKLIAASGSVGNAQMPLPFDATL